MTDSQFTRLLRRTAIALTRHQALLRLAVDEYTRRYGEEPVAHDNDAWIDSLEGGGGDGKEDITAAEVEEWAVMHGRKRYKHQRRTEEPRARFEEDGL